VNFRAGNSQFALLKGGMREKENFNLALMGLNSPLQGKFKPQEKEERNWLRNF